MKRLRIFLNGKTILTTSIIAIGTTILVVYLTGLTSHRTILENSLISLTILAIIFFLFLTIGLYKGLHINDNLSHKIKLKWGFSEPSIFREGSIIPETPGSFDAGEGIEGVLISIALWIVMTILFILFLIVIEFVLWAGILAFTALIYWIFIRALKLIFSKSAECQKNLPKSIAFGAGYTIMYIGWVYGVIWVSVLF